MKYRLDWSGAAKHLQEDNGKAEKVSVLTVDFMHRAPNEERRNEKNSNCIMLFSA